MSYAIIRNEKLTRAKSYGAYVHNDRKAKNHSNKEIDISNDLRVVARRAIYQGVSIRINSLQYNVSSKCGNCVARVGNSGEIEIH